MFQTRPTNRFGKTLVFFLEIVIGGCLIALAIGAMVNSSASYLEQ